MNITTTKIPITTNQRTEFKDITNKIKKQINIKEGKITIYTPHTTSGITINENESGLVQDMKKILKKLVKKEGWKHDKIDNNADSHLRGMLLNTNESIPIKNGKLSLGTWQSIFFVELDGPRKRKITSTIIGKK